MGTVEGLRRSWTQTPLLVYAVAVMHLAWGLNVWSTPSSLASPIVAVLRYAPGISPRAVAVGLLAVGLIGLVGGCLGWRWRVLGRCLVVPQQVVLIESARAALLLMWQVEDMDHLPYSTRYVINDYWPIVVLACVHLFVFVRWRNGNGGLL